MSQSSQRATKGTRKKQVMKLNGTAVIVTGGASGLGAATARCLAEAGAKVAILDLNSSAAEGLAKETGGLAIACNVADEESAKAAIAKAKSAHGVASVLVNCAGIGTAGRIVGKEGPMLLQQFQNIINVNLVGSFNMMRLTAAEMITAEGDEEGERGVIISTASVAAYEGQIGQAAYAASKGGIVSLTLPAAR
jgi:NAD(P)-dependent dehydrogenase (short-subunit alcohol dehydrogenase family)